jgi:hypothetical protein
MVYLCNSIAAINPLVAVEVVNTEEFPDLVDRFRVSQVPKVLINESVEVLDVVPPATLIGKIVSATAPPATTPPGAAAGPGSQQA